MSSANHRLRYGYLHQKARRSWVPVVESGQAICCLCGNPIKPGVRWHLDHKPGGNGYRGIAHAHCNVVDGAKRGAMITNTAATLRRRLSRKW